MKERPRAQLLTLFIVHTQSLPNCLETTANNIISPSSVCWLPKVLTPVHSAHSCKENESSCHGPTCIIHLKIFPSASEVSRKEYQKDLLWINKRGNGEFGQTFQSCTCPLFPTSCAIHIQSMFAMLWISMTLYS